MPETVRCEGCGRPFERRRQDHRHCSPNCRLRGMARRRVEELRLVLTTLETARAWVLAEIERWEGVAKGERRSRSRDKVHGRPIGGTHGGGGGEAGGGDFGGIP